MAKHAALNRGLYYGSRSGRTCRMRYFRLPIILDGTLRIAWLPRLTEPMATVESVVAADRAERGRAYGE
jgi:hypothetical protein